MEKIQDTRKDMNEVDKEKNISQVEIVENFSEKALENILFFEKSCFPEKWQYADADQYYTEMLKDKKNINIFLKFDDKVGGYLLAVPFKNAFDGLKEYDPELKADEEDETKIYLETIQILPEFRGTGGSEKLIMKMCEEAKKRGMKKFSIHARKLNCLDEKVKKMFVGKISESRDIEEWYYGGDEPYKYIECYI